MADEEPLRGFLWPFIFRSVGRRRRRIPAASGCQRNRQRGADYSRAARPRSEGCGGHGDQQHAKDQRREEGREGRGRGRLLSLGAQLWLLRPHHRAAARDRRRQRYGEVQEWRFESDDSKETASAGLAEKDRADRRLTCPARGPRGSSKMAATLASVRWDSYGDRDDSLQQQETTEGNEKRSIQGRLSHSVL